MSTQLGAAIAEAMTRTPTQRLTSQHVRHGCVRLLLAHVTDISHLLLTWSTSQSL